MSGRTGIDLLPRRRLPRLVREYLALRDAERQIEQSLSAFGHANASVRIKNRRGSLRAYQTEIGRRGDRLILRLDLREAALNAVVNRAASVLAIMLAAGPTVTRLAADLGDGTADSGFLTFCSNRPDAVLIPDSDFMNHRGYADVRTAALAAPAWRDREDEILWRGSTTGQGLITDEDLSVGNMRLTQRTRLALAMRGMPGTNVKFSQIVQTGDARDRERLASAGLLGENIPLHIWAARKFAFDVDGNANAWSNFFTRLLFGCCVLKVESAKDWRQWYYHDLKPWTHYVPIAADLSNATQTVAWCRDHETECETIAAAGQAFAMERTFETELAHAAEIVKVRFGSSAA